MKPAHPSTVQAQAAVVQALDFSDRHDFDDAQRGFVGTLPQAQVAADDGGVAWSLAPYAFLDGEAPATVNPSLWRMAQLNAIHGLFEVSERVYQVRGFSLANVTFVEGERGVIVIDPLQFTEHARAALALYRHHRGPRPVSAVIYTHSHRDHYGGVRGVYGEEEQRLGVPVIGPVGFTEECFSESILAGVPMRRRAMFQFGWSLKPGPMAHVDCGLGKAVGRGGDGFVAPTLLIREPIETHTVDGVECVFHLTSGTEAPANMSLHFPALKVLNLAEIACHTMHNLCPLRGAKTRDALEWARCLDDALEMFVPQAEVLVVQHHWPVWGRERMAQYVAGQRDLYRYLHDQTLRLMSKALTPSEIAEALLLPSALSRQWFARGYYGAVAHNVAAVYAHYLGPFEGNPARLNPLPPTAAAQRHVAYMGGADAVVARAQADFSVGEFRWVVEVLNLVVFAEPGHRAARELAADAMEQLGYQAESATWRNAYLLGALELRSNAAARAPTGVAISPDVVAVLPLARFLEYLAIRVDGPKAQNISLRLDWRLVDGTQVDAQRLVLSHGALNHRPGSHGAHADAVIETTRAQLAAHSAGRTTLLAGLASGTLPVHGNRALVQQFFEALDEFDPMFNVVEP